MEVFLGKDILVQSELQAPGKDLVITFTSRRNKPGPAGSGFAADFCAKKGIPALHFISTRNHWWQTPEMIDACEAVNELRARHGFNSVTSYGSSMGAHGALLFSELLHVDRVLALGPQFAINGRKAIWSEAWARETRDIEEVFDMETYCSRKAKLYVAVDPFDSFDMQHIRALSSIRSCEILRVPFGHHPPAKYLVEEGLLSPLVQQVVAGNFVTAAMRRQIRDGRRKNLTYLMGLYQALKNRGNKPAAGKIIEQAHTILVEHLHRDTKLATPSVVAAQIIERAWMTASSAHNADAHLAELKLLGEKEPDEPHSFGASCRINIKIGRLEDALRDVRRAAKIDRKNLPWRIEIARVLMLMGDAASANIAVDEAIKIPAKRNINAWKYFYNYFSDLLEPDVKARLVSLMHNWDVKHSSTL